jgi:hypothetical protein
VYSGCRGLLAAQQLVPGQLVLLSSPQNTLAVPLGKNLHRWEHEWLEPFEQAHATLPSALVDVLMEPLDKIGRCGAHGIHSSTTQAHWSVKGRAC